MAYSTVASKLSAIKYQEAVKENAKKNALINQGNAAAQLASEYLDKWNEGISDLKGYYNVAIEGIKESFQTLEEGNQWVDEDLRGLIGEIDSSLAEYKSVYDPLRDESVAAAREGIAAERQLTNTLTGLATPDYEGSAGIAKADVASESEKARKADVREMQGLGISPTSGNYAERMRRSRVDEAINKVLAGNMARINEKSRVGTLAVEGLNAINPNASYAGANAISMGELDYLKEKGSQIKTGIDAKNQYAQTGAELSNAATNVANSYGKYISEPYSELYSANQGIATKLNPSSVTNS
jgi:hypothetical protein